MKSKLSSLILSIFTLLFTLVYYYKNSHRASDTLHFAMVIIIAVVAGITGYRLYTYFIKKEK